MAKQLRWFHFTRLLGVVVLLYGLLLDDSPERGTIILGGFGLVGFDKVARSEPSKRSNNGTAAQQ